MAAGERLDMQERRSRTGETQRQKKETIRDTETVNPLGDGPVKLGTARRERANPSEPVAVVREQLTSPTGRFYSPLLCV